MIELRRAILAPTLAFLLGVVSGQAVAAEADGPRVTPSALSSADRLSYTTAFDALRRGDLDLARASARQANDRVLLGQVEFERLFHPDHTATYEELAAWLDDYADLPCAARAYDLALRRRPDGAAEPRRPSGVNGRTWAAVAATAGGSTEHDPSRAARVAYNRDDLTTALALGQQLGDWWTAGLAAYRLQDYSAAFQAFERVAVDPTQDPWVRAGAAVWTSKAAGLSGRQDRIQEYLRLAARWPATFYGQIAMRQLDEEPVIENLGPRPYEATVRRANYQADEPVGVGQDELDAFVRSDANARRTVALAEVGRRSDAVNELRAGLSAAASSTGRRMWLGLARALGPRVLGSRVEASRIDADLYPMPDLQPQGGFTVERALVLAVARKETNFNASARSPVGAYGLMQVMPTTAAELSGDSGFVTDPARLFQPDVNARMGQAYINKVLAMPAINGDLLRMAASYNAGPGPTVAAIRKLGLDADPLLLIETIDVPQARDYVEKVVAAYWIYQRLLGAPLNTLDAVASGATAVPLTLDYVAPPPAPVEVASAPAVQGGL